MLTTQVKSPKKILPIILIFTMVQRMTTTTTKIILMMLVMAMAPVMVKMILMMMMTNVDLRLVQPWLGHPFSICLVATSPPHRSNGQWSSFSSTLSWELSVQFCTNSAIQMTYKNDVTISKLKAPSQVSCLFLLVKCVIELRAKNWDVTHLTCHLCLSKVSNVLFKMTYGFC